MQDGCIYVWKENYVLQICYAHRGPVTALCVVMPPKGSAMDSRCYSAGCDSSVQYWRFDKVLPSVARSEIQLANYGTIEHS